MPSITDTTPTRTFRYSSALDNHPVTRDSAYGTGELYAADVAFKGQDETIIITSSQFKDAEKANYIIDDGMSVRVFYVAGWNSQTAWGQLYLQPFPTNPTGATRPDNGRVIDYSTWALGPRRTYHLKVTWIDDPMEARLEYLRREIHAERISQGEVLELQSLAEHINPGDVELLEWAGVPEFPEEDN